VSPDGDQTVHATVLTEEQLVRALMLMQLLVHALMQLLVHALMQLLMLMRM
jgi:hypothetical protein